jgi:hypothetical protein
MAAVSELSVFFHLEGQILQTSKNKRFSLYNRENVFSLQDLGSSKIIMFTDWDISLNVEYIDLSEIKEAECLVHQKSYDQCMLTPFLQLHNNSGLFQLFFEDDLNRIPDLESVSTEILQDFYNTITSNAVIRMCSNSCTYLQVMFSQKPNRKY